MADVVDQLRAAGKSAKLFDYCFHHR